MKIRITQLPNKILRKRSQEVTFPLNDQVELFIRKLIYHIDESQKPGSIFRAGVGVAAVQQGRLLRIFYINSLYMARASDRLRDVVINPVVISHSDDMVALASGEGCLSVPEHIPHQKGYVPRYQQITVEGYSYTHKRVMQYHAEGYLAVVFQHELDHLEGLLFIDRINKQDPFSDAGLELLEY